MGKYDVTLNINDKKLDEIFARIDNARRELYESCMELEILEGITIEKAPDVTGAEN